MFYLIAYLRFCVKIAKGIGVKSMYDYELELDWMKTNTNVCGICKFLLYFLLFSLVFIYMYSYP